VTNALGHTVTGLGGRFDVTILGGETSLTIAVTDNGSDKVPAASALDPEAEAGRGLGLVELIAEQWDTAADTTAAPSGSSCAGRAYEALRPSVLARIG
jgi:hypothetical protein